MKTIVLSFEWNCFPIWIYNENHIVILNNLPKEWKNNDDFKNLLSQAQSLYDSAFIDTPKVFDFIGFQHKDDMEKMQSLLTQIRDFIKNNLPKGYVFEDRVIKHNQLKDFDYKEDK